MLANAFRELRLHPGRFAAVLTAIALSIAFLTAVQVFVSTEKQGAGKGQVIFSSNADVVVGGSFKQPDKVVDILKKADGVTAAEPVLRVTNTVTHNGKREYVDVFTVPTSESLRWQKAAEGSLPTKADEIVLAKATAAKLNAKVGDTLKLVSMGSDKNLDYKLVGLADEPGSFSLPAYVTYDGAKRGMPEQKDDAGAVVTPPPTAWIVDAKDKAAATALTKSLPAQLESGAQGEKVTVNTAADEQAKAVKAMANDFDVMKYLLWVFGAIALLVGAIIISNTFAILVTQRRRQTGLLRALGASRGQVFGRYFAESFALGLVGSVLGIAGGILLAMIPSQYFTGSLRFGLVVEPLPLVAILAIGIIVTMLASLAPLRKALQVAPLEALRPVESAEKARRGSLVRAIITGLLFAAGMALCLWSLSSSKNNILIAVGGAILITLGVLGAAPLYVPLFLKGLGKVFGWTPTARLAATNAARNPSRAGATATALMLAVGLIVTLGVGSATIKETMNTKMDESYPLDILVMPGMDFHTGEFKGEVPDAALEKMRKIDGMKAMESTRFIAMMDTKDARGPFGSMVMLAGHTDALDKALPNPVTVADDEILLHPDVMKRKNLAEGATVTYELVPFSMGQPDPSKPGPTPVTLSLKAKSSKVVANSLVMVSEKTLLKNFPDAKKGLVYGSVSDRSKAAAITDDLQRIINDDAPGAMLDGALFMKVMLTKALDTLLAIVTALLGVAALIALIGVGNTLSLSVLERTRESALLRALGLQARSLRLMLLIEALLLAAVATIVGIVAGGFFGWIGISAVLKQMGTSGIVFAYDWRQLVGVVVVATLAAVIASILPGRKAAKATPVEALADVG